MNMLIIGMGLLLYHFGFHWFGAFMVGVGAMRAGISLLVELLS